MQEGETNGLEVAEIKKEEIVYDCIDLDIPVPENENVPTEGEKNFLDSAYKAILDEIIEDAIWDLCFEVHRAIKVGENNQVVNNSARDIFGTAQNYRISCPICTKKQCATRFSSHLAKCSGVGGYQNSQRAPFLKMAASNDLDELDYGSDNSVKSKKRAKRNAARRKKAKLQGNAMADKNANYLEMSYEQRKSFFDQMCGVISKRTNRMCTKTLKCSQHTEEEKKDIRQFLLSDMNDQITHGQITDGTDGQINVDTVDQGNGGLDIFMQNLTSCSTSEKSGSPISDTKEIKPSTSSKNGSSSFKKKKSEFSPSNSSMDSPSPSTTQTGFFD